MSLTQLVEDLPAFLRQRCVIRRDGHVREDRGFVLYVLTDGSLRARDNPSLDVCELFAARFGTKGAPLPIVVYARLDDGKRAPWATQRRATFVLESLRELERELLEARSLPLSVHVLKDGDRRRADLTLASQAAVVVSDEFFTEYRLPTMDALARIGTPFVTVDTACIYPARMTKREDCWSASRFRKATMNARLRMMKEGYPSRSSLGLTAEPAVPSYAARCEMAREKVRNGLTYDSGRGFQDNSLFRQADFSLSVEKLLEGTWHDKQVGPVSSTTQGGRRAALRRWSNFLNSQGLQKYASRRNNPLAGQGVSRMSPYLNTGVMSPWRVAHDATQASSSKFIDEFGTWRELAYSFCHHHPNHISKPETVIPGWALKTLRQRAKIETETRELKSHSELSEARTGDPVWDLMQTSLLLNGELHNNLRMTWGKGVLRWTSGPEDAYHALLYLNDRYALDGMAPPGVAGIAWCLGWADGPKEERTVFGSVRSRYSSAVRCEIEALRSLIEGRAASVVGGGTTQGAGEKRKRDPSITNWLLPEDKGAS